MITTNPATAWPMEYGTGNSLTLSYDLDEVDQVTKISRATGGASAEVIRYEYQDRFMTQRTITTDYAHCTVEVDHDRSYDVYRRLDGITNTVGTTGTWGGRTLSDYVYTFDKVGNRLTTDASASANYGGGTYKLQKDVDYLYDTLYRLTNADYTTDSESETFVYDDLGNRIAFTRRDTTDTVYANNKANEYTTVGGTSVTYDAAGNISRDERDFEYLYDHDNRLTKVTNVGAGGPVEVAHYAYDALGRMVSSRTRYDSDDNADTETLRYYHDGANVFQEYDGGGATLQRYYVHGTSFIDERAIVFDNVEGEEYYYSLKDLYTVDGLVNDRGHEVERYTYDAYGKAEIHSVPIEDVDYSGSVNVFDEGDIQLRIGQNVCNYGPIYDLDGDGDIDAADVTVANNANGNSVTALNASGIRNPYLFTGRRLFMLEEDLSGLGGAADNQPLQYNRNRHYDPEHGRWLQRDPAGYVDGMNLYEYVSSRPTHLVDLAGLWGMSVHYGYTRDWASQGGYRWSAATQIGVEDHATDGGDFGGQGVGWRPDTGDQSRHFNRNWAGRDSRLVWLDDEMKAAKGYCNGGNKEDPRMAAQSLGRALHSIQDWWAHGGYSAGIANTWTIHASEYDDWYGTWDADPADSADGRAPQVFRDAGNGFREEIQYGTGYYQNGRTLYGAKWNRWRDGTKRNEGTKFDTKRKLRHFRLYVETYSGCACRDYFLSPNRGP